MNVALKGPGERASAAYRPAAACDLVPGRGELRRSYCQENVACRCPGGVVEELDTDGARRTLAGIRKACDTVDLTGGEPALRSDLEELLGTCRELGIGEIMLNSNGLHLLERLPALRHAHSVMLGVDALSEEGFCAITGGTPAQHRAQREALETLWRLQGEYGFDLELCTVMLDDHLEEIEPILDWRFEHQVLVSLSPHIDPELCVEARLRADPRYRALAARLVEHKRAGRPLLGSLAYYEGLRDLPRHDCVPMANLTVRPRGELFWPCGELQNRGPTFLEGKSYRQMVDEARARLGPAPDCRDRCHFSCRLAFSALIHHPTELPSESRFMRRYRRYGR